MGIVRNIGYVSWIELVGFINLLMQHVLLHQIAALSSIIVYQVFVLLLSTQGNSIHGASRIIPVPWNSHLPSIKKVACR